MNWATCITSINLNTFFFAQSPYYEEIWVVWFIEILKVPKTAVCLSIHTQVIWGFSGGAGGKEPTCQCRRQKRFGLDPWVGRIPEGGNGNPLQYSCLEHPRDRGAWWATVHRVVKSRTQLKQLSIHTRMHPGHTNNRHARGDKPKMQNRSSIVGGERGLGYT